MRLKIFLCTCLFLWFCSAGFTQDKAPGDAGFAGEFSGFGVKVPKGNYYVAKGALVVFGTKWGPAPQNPQELEDRVWEDLVLSFEAYKRGIKVEDNELNDEVDKMLKAEKAGFDRIKDPQAYAKWIKDKTGEPRELFENQLRHLIQLQKLRQQVMDGVSPQVSDAEAMQKFRDEYNTLSVELAQFDNEPQARAFYDKARKNEAVWDKETKDNPKLFRKPGFVALEFLVEMWRFPKDDAYKMMKLSVGTIYPPIPIYGGKYAVCRIIEKRLAEDSKFPELRKYYIQQVQTVKKYQALNDWIQKLKDDAQIKVYKDVDVLPKEKAGTK